MFRPSADKPSRVNRSSRAFRVQASKKVLPFSDRVEPLGIEAGYRGQEHELPLGESSRCKSQRARSMIVPLRAVVENAIKAAGLLRPLLSRVNASGRDLIQVQW